MAGQGQGVRLGATVARADLQALGDDAPQGPILGAHVATWGAKQALLADDPDVFFTTPHFDGYPAILVRLGGDRVEGTPGSWSSRPGSRAHPSGWSRT